MKRITRNLPVFLLLTLMLMFLVSGCGDKSSDKQKSQEEKAVPVTVAAVESGVINNGTVVSGKLEALSSAKVVPSGSGGKISEVRVDIGSKVQQGQVLIVLENNLQSAQINEARARVNMARTNFQISSDNYERGKKLLEQGAIARATFDVQYEQTYEQARQGLTQAQAGLDMAREGYENTIIKSPITGVITSRSVNPGEMASPGISVVSVVNLDKVVVQATVAEDTINKIKQGQEVDVLVDAVSAAPLKGVITNIAPAADQMSKAFPIKVQIDNPDHKLKPGMFAEVNLTGERTNTLRVPRESVVKVEGKDSVWLVDKDKAVLRAVEAGTSDGSFIEIKQGLKEGEQVVVSGQDALKNNAAIEIKN